MPAEHRPYGTILSSRDAEPSAASPLADEVVRLHILANSDSEQDQHIKLLLRNALLPSISSITQSASSKEEALDLLAAQCNKLTELANQTLTELQVPYRATVRIQTLYFPIRIYGSRTFLSEDATIFPPGSYDSLQIVLGRGDGHNWWCLAYPSLCFIDSTYEYIPKNSRAYKEKFSTIQDSSLRRLFYGRQEEISSDKKTDIYLESKFWNLITTKIKKLVLH